MSYQILIDALTLPVHIGLYDIENQAPQPIECHLVITLSSTQAGQSDAIEDTLHYGQLCEHLVDFASQTRYQLLERLATAIMDAIEAYHPVEHIEIRLIKRNPDVLPHVKGAGVCMQRACS